VIKSNNIGVFFLLSVFVLFYIETDLSHSETRLSVYLDNFELHVYNRTAVYSNLEKLFGIDQLLPRPSESAQELVASVFDSGQIFVFMKGLFLLKSESSVLCTVHL